MNILDYLKSTINKHVTKTNYGTEEKPNISFNEDRFSCSYLEKDNLIISNGIVNGNNSLELKAVYSLSKDKTGIANFSHFEKEYNDENETIKLFYRNIDDVVSNRLFKSVHISFEDGYFSTSKKVSQKLYKLDENNSPVCFFLRDTCTNKTNADCMKDILDVKSSKPLIRTIKTSSQLRHMNLSSGNVNLKNFQSLTNETKVKYSLDDKTVLFYKNQESYSQNGPCLKLKTNTSSLKQNHKGKVVFENDKIMEASGNLAMNFLNKKQSGIESDKDCFEKLVRSYCFPGNLQDVCALSNDTSKNSVTDFSTEDYLENKFYFAGFDKSNHMISKFDIHSSLLETISNFNESINIFEKPADPNEIDDDKDFDTYSDLGFSVNK